MTNNGALLFNRQSVMYQLLFLDSCPHYFLHTLSNYPDLAHARGDP
jgi:hypothetical protein